MLQQDTSELLARPEGRCLAEQLMKEVVAGGNAQPLREKIDGPAFIERMLYLTDQMDHYKPSMMIDREERRSLELEAIYGIPLQQAKEFGAETPPVITSYSIHYTKLYDTPS